MDCRWLEKVGKRVLFYFHIFNLVGQKDAHAYVPTHMQPPSSVLPCPALASSPCDILSAFVLLRVFNKNLKLRLFR